MDEMEWEKMKLQGKLLQNFLPTLIGMIFFMLILSMFDKCKARRIIYDNGTNKTKI